MLEFCLPGKLIKKASKGVIKSARYRKALITGLITIYTPITVNILDMMRCVAPYEGPYEGSGKRLLAADLSVVCSVDGVTDPTYAKYRLISIFLAGVFVYPFPLALTAFTYYLYKKDKLRKRKVCLFVCFFFFFLFFFFLLVLLVGRTGGFRLPCLRILSSIVVFYLGSS